MTVKEFKGLRGWTWLQVAQYFGASDQESAMRWHRTGKIVLHLDGDKWALCSIIREGKE